MTITSILGPWPKLSFRLVASTCTAALFLIISGCGGGGDGNAIEARPQSIQMGSQPATIPLGAMTLNAAASSDLAVSYRSLTPGICTVNTTTGVLNATGLGTCSVQVTQSGDERYAPASPLTVQFAVVTSPQQTIAFDAAPTLTLGGAATATAHASSGLAITYSSLTPAVCAVDSSSGSLSSLTLGQCTIAADQSGDTYYQAATQVTLQITVAIPSGLTAPGSPAGVTVTAGNAANTVIVKAGGVNSGGSPITGYRVRSAPAGIDVTAASLPVTVTCPSACAGRAFTLTAINALGEGSVSIITNIITRYNVVLTFHEPDTQPRNSIFVGSFTFDATDAVVSDLNGQLTESMTGSATSTDPDYEMTKLTLNHQLSFVADGDGWLVTTFLNSSTDTFWRGLGGDGWTPEAGIDVGGIYQGFPMSANNPGNAYVRIFVNALNPLTPLTTAQIDKLAYADCAPGGMMGAVCMTGTSVAGYGAVGTMSGYPISQSVTLAP